MGKISYSEEQIKKAYWVTFHQAGELWFENLSSDEENEKATENEWEEFLENLKLTRSLSDTSKLLNRKLCTIVGADSASDFKLEVPLEEINEKAQDIWDNPGKYYEFSDSYYDFLKFLWIEYPDNSEKRLVDIINTD